jgi:hypothetical protein
MKKEFKINVWDLVFAGSEEPYDLKKIKIKEVDKFTGDIILAIEFEKEKS